MKIIREEIFPNPDGEKHPEKLIRDQVKEHGVEYLQRAYGFAIGYNPDHEDWETCAIIKKVADEFEFVLNTDYTFEDTLTDFITSALKKEEDDDKGAGEEQQS